MSALSDRASCSKVRCRSARTTEHAIAGDDGVTDRDHAPATVAAPLESGHRGVAGPRRAGAADTGLAEPIADHDGDPPGGASDACRTSKTARQRNFHGRFGA